MNALLSFAPILALIALYSVEVTAEGTYSSLKDAGHINGFELSYTVDVEPAVSITGAGSGSGTGGCSIAQISGDTCTLTPANWDNDNTVTATMTLPPVADLSVPEGVGAPSTVKLKACFAPPSTVNKKWRKIKDNFGKDNSCKGGVSSDKFDYTPGAASQTMTFGSKTPTGFFAIRAFVQCSEQSGDNFCHVVNWVNKGDEAGAVFFPTEVMDSRPNNLFVAVFICAFIGPVLLLAFLIYERGILAKQNKA